MNSMAVGMSQIQTIYFLPLIPITTREKKLECIGRPSNRRQLYSSCNSQGRHSVDESLTDGKTYWTMYLLSLQIVTMRKVQLERVVVCACSISPQTLCSRSKRLSTLVLYCIGNDRQLPTIFLIAGLVLQEVNLTNTTVVITKKEGLLKKV